jgi:hypothetical protein
MNEDAEVKAIGLILKTLETLEADQREAVLAYMQSRFKIKPTVPLLIDPPPSKKRQGKKRSGGGKARQEGDDKATAFSPDITALANQLKELVNYDDLASAVLNKRDPVNLILLALGMYHSKYDASDGLTSGDVVKFYRQLSIPLDQPTISRALSDKDKAAKFVLTDGERRKGAILRYRLSRSGLLKAVDLKILDRP